MTDEPQVVLWLLSNIATAAFGFFSRDLFRVLRESVQAMWLERTTRRRHQERMQVMSARYQHQIKLRNLDIESQVIKRGMDRGYGYE